MRSILICILLAFNMLSNVHFSLATNDEALESNVTIVSIPRGSLIYGYILLNGEMKFELPIAGIMVVNFDKNTKELTSDASFNVQTPAGAVDFVNYIKQLPRGKLILGGSGEDISRGLEPHVVDLQSQGLDFSYVKYRDTMAFTYEKDISGHVERNSRVLIYITLIKKK